MEEALIGPRLHGPIVAAVMITANREKYVKRAIECFHRQTYNKKHLVIYNTGEPLDVPLQHNMVIVEEPKSAGRTVGALRNIANSLVAPKTEVILHWDDDDWSGPQRIETQVGSLVGLARNLVGYNSMLFWDERRQQVWRYKNGNPHYALGTSFCYWRAIWATKPFLDVNEGEDTFWSTGMPSVRGEDAGRHMVARIHASNTSMAYNPELMAAIAIQGGEWSREQSLDKQLKQRMEV